MTPMTLRDVLGPEGLRLSLMNSAYRFRWTNTVDRWFRLHLTSIDLQSPKEIASDR